jgi:four helix bundle protein
MSERSKVKSRYGGCLVAVIERFEDIAAWQGARTRVKAVYHATEQGAFARDYALRDQVRRAAISIMSNIAEGSERNSDKEFRHFLYVAKASAGEVRSLLYVARDLDYIEDAAYQQLTGQSIKLGRQIAGFIRYLDGRSPHTNRREA